MAWQKLITNQLAGFRMSENPYEPTLSSGSIESKKESVSATSEYRYKSLGFLTTSICIALVTLSICNVLVNAIETACFSIYPEFCFAEFVPDDPIGLGMLFVMSGFGIVSILAYLWNVVAVPMFTYRSNANLRACGIKGLNYSPEVSSVFWFIPIMNLFRPYQVYKEVFVESHVTDENPLPTPNTSVVGIWWGTWLVGDILGRITFRIGMNAPELGTNYLILSWFSTISLCFAAVFLINILVTISKKQQAMNDSIADIEFD